jgi:hypothetical protein
MVLILLPWLLNGSGQGDTQPLGTVVETVVSLHTELEVAIHYPRPRRPTATAVAERQRPSLPEPSDLDLGKECQPVRTKRMYAGYEGRREATAETIPTMDWKTHGPALMHRCRHAKHPHSLMESTSPNR